MQNVAADCPLGRKSTWAKWLCGWSASLALAAQAQIDLTALDRQMTGPRAQVLVLGSVHLSEMPQGFNPAALDGLLNRLAAFKPDIITIEALAGEECDRALRYASKYGPDYCPPTNVAQAATGLDVPAAIAALDQALQAFSPAQATPPQRRRLAALFLAANDRASAYVQWLQLPEGERRADASLNAALVAQLERIATRNNENYQIGARLAARLGLQRVHAVDDHTGDNIAYTDRAAFGRAVEAAWAAGRAELDAREQQELALKQATDLLPLYRFINDPAHLRVLADVNVAAALRASSPQAYPQIWVAGWEIRNLRMVANIHESFRERPGARVLAIVGVSHKPWFDAWLGQLQGLDSVDVAAVLSAAPGAGPERGGDDQRTAQPGR